MSQKPPPEQGYPRLAARMGLFPETAIFTRFSDLTARNLLYLQAELLHLRAYLEKLEMEARGADKEKAKRWARSWWDLCHEPREEGSDNGQWNLVLNIREKMKEYEKALIRAQTIAHFHKPFTSDLHDLQAYIDSSLMDKRPFRAVESSVWGNLNHPKECARDLAALRIRQVDDPFTEMVMTRLVRPFFRIIGHRFIKKDPSLEAYADGEFKDHTAREFARAITTFLACIILVGSINVLYFIPKSSMVSRIGAIWAFSVVFALCLLVFAKIMSDSKLIGNTTLAISAGVLTAAVLWSNRRRTINTNEASYLLPPQWSIANANNQKEDFVRILDIFDSASKIKARLDTGADYSILSKEIVDTLDLCEEALYENEDPLSVVLPDRRMFSFRSKVTLTFHVVDPPRGYSLFHFNKYEYTATFYVPANGDIASFDAYIGKDIIAKYHLQSSSFFASGSGDGKDGQELKDTTTSVMRDTKAPSQEFDTDTQTLDQQVTTSQTAAYATTLALNPGTANAGAPTGGGSGATTGHASGTSTAPPSCMPPTQGNSASGGYDPGDFGSSTSPAPQDTSRQGRNQRAGSGSNNNSKPGKDNKPGSGGTDNSKPDRRKPGTGGSSA